MAHFSATEWYDKLPSQKRQKTDQLKNTKQKRQVAVVSDKMWCCIGGD